MTNSFFSLPSSNKIFSYPNNSLNSFSSFEISIATILLKMVRATIIVSALFALVASVSAVPHRSWPGFTAQRYTGVGNVNLKNALKDAVSVDNLEVNGKFITERFICLQFGLIFTLYHRCCSKYRW